jgi:hypothetical protein
MQTVGKAVDEQMKNRSSEPSVKQYGMQTVVKPVDERRNERLGEQSSARRTLATSSTSGKNE